jgi:hypothetical protein
MIGLVGGGVSAVVDIATKKEVSGQDIMVDVAAVGTQLAFPTCPTF